MVSIPNNVRFRFNDMTKASEVIVSTKDYDNLVKKIAKQVNNKKTAKDIIHNVFYGEIVRAYGVPKTITLVLDSKQVSIH